MEKIDKIDKKIIFELQNDADKKTHELEKKLKIPRSTIHNRIVKLKKNKVIKSIKASVDAESLGLNICAMIHVVISSKRSAKTIAEKISQKKNVTEVFITAGSFDIICKVYFKNNSELSKFIFDEKTGLRSMDGIDRTETMICLDIIKENGVLE